MNYTNKHNLPDRVIRVLIGKYKQRRPELNRLSITDLIDDPLPRILYINHWDDIVRDYSDLITMVQGISLHSRYEDNAAEGDNAELKLEDAIEEMIVVGKADINPENVIIEVKQTGVYGPKYRMEKWTKQMNAYAWQRGKRGQQVDELLVDVWYRDWKQKNTYWKDYPQIPYEELKLNLWSFEKQDKYIRSQVQKHVHHPVFDTPEQYEKPCSDKQRGIRWEAYKKTNKTPTKVGETYDEVSQWTQKQKDIFRIEQSEAIFCSKYCKSRSVCKFSGVSQ